MEHAREPIVRFLHDLVGLFGAPLAATLISLVVIGVVAISGIVLYFGYIVLQSGGATFREALGAGLEALKVLRYQPKQKTHLSIRLELYFDAALGMIMFLSLVGLLAHALIPWVTERSEKHLFEVLVSSGILFVLLGGVSITMAARFPQD
jgi:hypothetical protein